MRPSPLLAAIALSCAASPAVRRAEQDILDWNRARAAVAEAAGHAPCQEDWECVRFQPHLAGCGQFAPRGFASQELRDILEDACARFSFAQACPEAVGACVAGHCGARLPRRERPCLEARRAMARALPAEVACSADRDCDVALDANPHTAVPMEWAARYGRELHAVRDACRADEDVPTSEPGFFVTGACAHALRLDAGPAVRRAERADLGDLAHSLPAGMIARPARVARLARPAPRG